MRTQRLDLKRYFLSPCELENYYNDLYADRPGSPYYDCCGDACDDDEEDEDEDDTDEYEDEDDTDQYEEETARTSSNPWEEAYSDTCDIELGLQLKP